jgi:hypothetical protein
VDYYLRIQDGDSLGVKLREGSLEVKQRYGRQETLRFGTRTVGYLEHWRKWHFQVANPNEILAELGVSSDTWVGVRKARRQRMYQVVDTGKFRAVNIEVQLMQGCSWEVAALQIEGTGDAWWSLCFEAFGEQAERREILIAVIEYALSLDKAPNLNLNASYGYPKWLQLMGL